MRSPAWRLETLAVLVVLAALVGLRAGRLGLDPHPDELALVAAGGVLDALVAPEGGVNPPLLPVLFNLLPVPWVLPVARLAAWLASVGTLAGLAWLARDAVRDRPGAALAAVTLLGVAPRHVAVSAMLRSYAFWGLAWTLHAVALRQATGPQASRGARWAWLASLALLGWLHYAALPLAVLELAWLATEGRRGRELLRTTPWLLAAWAPLAVPLAVHADARARTSPPAEVLELLLTFGLGGRGTPAVLPALVVVPLLVAAVGWRRSDAVARAALVAALGALVLLPLIGTQHAVRTQATVLFLVPWSLVAATLPVPGVGGAALRLALAGGLASLLYPHAQVGRMRPEDPHGWQAVARDWPRWQAEGAVWVEDERAAVMLCFAAAERRTFAHAAPEPACAGEAFCCDHDGVVVRAVRQPPWPGLLVRPRSALPWSPPTGCTLQPEAPHYLVARCGSAPTAPHDPTGASP